MKRLRDIYFVVEAPRLLYVCALYTGVPSKAKAMALFPFILVKSKADTPAWLITHERIHFHQQLDSLYVGNFLLSAFEYVYARVWLRCTSQQAYLFISGEQEAYRNQHDENYLGQRKRYAHWWYFKNKRSIKIGSDGEVVMEELS